MCLIITDELVIKSQSKKDYAKPFILRKNFFRQKTILLMESHTYMEKSKRPQTPDKCKAKHNFIFSVSRYKIVIGVCCVSIPTYIYFVSVSSPPSKALDTRERPEVKETENTSEGNRNSIVNRIQGIKRPFLLKKIRRSVSRTKGEPIYSYYRRY